MDRDKQSTENCTEFVEHHCLFKINKDETMITNTGESYKYIFYIEEAHYDKDTITYIVSDEKGEKFMFMINSAIISYIKLTDKRYEGILLYRIKSIF